MIGFEVGEERRWFWSSTDKRGDCRREVAGGREELLPRDTNCQSNRPCGVRLIG